MQDSISLGSPQDSSHRDLYKIMQGSPREDFTRIFSEGLVQGSKSLDLQEIFAKGAVQDHARTSWRGAHQDIHVQGHAS